jgi:hypothetical protein
MLLVGFNRPTQTHVLVELQRNPFNGQRLVVWSFLAEKA